MKQLDLPVDWPVSRETLERLRHYHGLLLKWQDKINLISPNTVSEAWVRHFIDAAQLAPLLPVDAKTLYDLGSGAGFPGMVLAIMQPDLAVTMIESDAKKCAFLQTVSRETGVNVTVKNARIEAAASGLSPPGIVTARALASLTELLDYCRPWLQNAGKPTFLFPKGRQFQAEIDEAKNDGWSFKMDLFESITDYDARILRLTDIELS